MVFSRKNDMGSISRRRFLDRTSSQGKIDGKISAIHFLLPSVTFFFNNNIFYNKVVLVIVIVIVIVIKIIITFILNVYVALILQHKFAECLFCNLFVLSHRY